ncbi:MAG: alpha-amylase [Deltaproteobacteria bacterium]|nr:MAG: alpha-amylase [Deltaproteobacteria bacterium]
MAAMHASPHLRAAPSAPGNPRHRAVWIPLPAALVLLALLGVLTSAGACAPSGIEDVTTDFPITSNVGDWREQVIYQIITDRFEDGDPNNNTRVKPGAMGRYQGGDFQGIIDRVDYLRELGVTTVWISPVVRNVDTDAGFDSYHGYWTQDFLSVNPHFGDLAKLREMVRVLQDNGILVLLDVVVNHVGQLFYYDINMNGQPDEFVAGSGTRSPVTRVSEYDPDFDIRGIQAFTSLGEAGPAPIRWFNMPEINRVPPLPAEFQNPDWYWRRGRVTVWGREGEACAEAGINAGEDWQACQDYVRLQEVTGDFPGGLKALRTDREDVREALIRVFQYWIRATNADGFRLDTVKHVDDEFWEVFSREIRSYAASIGKRNFFLVGEAFDGDSQLLASYVEPGRLDSIFDFAQKFRVFNAVFKFGGPTALIEELWNENAELYSAEPQPGGIRDAAGEGIPPRSALVNFIDNHDVQRFLWDAPEEDGAERLHAALMLLFTQAGIPALYYGTEQRFSGGNDPANREPMWDPASGPFDPWDTTNPTFTLIRDLIRVRRQTGPLMYGTQHIHWSTFRTGDEQDAGIFAFERRFNGSRALVALNTHPTQTSETSAEDLGFNRMGVTFAPGTTLVDIMPGSDGATFTVTTEGCDTAPCSQPVPDDYVGPSCGCLLVDVPPLSGRLLVPRR